MNPIRFGVLGCASIARLLAIPAMKSVPNIELVAVASRTREKAFLYASEFSCHAVTGYEELLRLPGIDAIYMPLPTGLHHEWAHRALDAGKHLFIEKSLACNPTEARSIIDKAQSKGLLIKENYMFEYHAQQAVVRELMRTRVGQIRVFRASFGFPPLQKDNFRYDSSLGGGALLDAGGYVLKALGSFFPSHVMRVRAANLTLGESGVDIAGAAMVDLECGGECIPAHVDFGFDHYYQCGVEIWGSKAKLTTNRTFTAGSSFAPSVRIETADGVETRELPKDNHFRNIFVHFVESVFQDDHTAEYQAILKQAELQENVRQAARLPPIV
jgi:predicted dehydrogenase